MLPSKAKGRKMVLRRISGLGASYIETNHTQMLQLDSDFYDGLTVMNVSE